MNNYVFVAPSVALGLFLVAFILLYHREKERREIAEYQQVKQHDLLLDYAYDADDYSVDLTSYADLHDALIDAQNEVKMLKSQTVELPEVKPAPKRTTRAKKGSTA